MGEGGPLEVSEAWSTDAAALTRDVIFSPIRGSGVVEQTVRRLGEAIDFGLLESGEQLPAEPELAARLQVSPTTLREALAALREARYLVTRRGRLGGTFVQAPEQSRLGTAQRMLPDLSVEQIRDLCDFREMIACGTATLSCARAQPDDLALLSELLGKMRAAQTYTAWCRIDSRFHITIAAAAKSPRLVAAEASIQAELGAALGLNAQHPRILRVIDDQHKRIFEAIAGGDVAGAVAATQAHVRNTAETLLGLSLTKEPSGGAVAQPRGAGPGRDGVHHGQADEH